MWEFCALDSLSANIFLHNTVTFYLTLAQTKIQRPVHERWHVIFHSPTRRDRREFPRRFCGILNAQRVGLVTAIERVMEHVYMGALAHPNADGDEDETRFPIVKNQLLPGLRSFCSALKGFSSVP